MQSWCRPGLALDPDTYRPQEGALDTASGVYSKCWPRGPIRQGCCPQDKGQRGCFRACACSLRSWPRSPAHPRTGAATRAEQAQRPAAPPLPRGRKRRETVVRLPAQTLRPSASGVRTQASRRVRTAGGAGVHPSVSPSHGVFSRELRVNSPEWSLEVCSPRRSRHPGPPGPECEAAAGTSGGALPEAPHLPMCAAVGACGGAPRARGPEDGGLRWRRLGPPCDPRPAGSGPGVWGAGLGRAVQPGV